MFAAAIRKRRLHYRSFSQWRWHLDLPLHATVISIKKHSSFSLCLSL